MAGGVIREAFRKGAQMNKKARGDEVRFARAQLSTGLAAKGVVLPPIMLGALFDELAAAEMRRLVFEESVRLDGRAPDELRPITCESGVIPRVHGSSIFERGETQSLVTVTVGALEEAQKVDDLGVTATKRLMVQYVFPPFSVNETGRGGGLTRREIGHGVLAERALAGMLPSEARCRKSASQCPEAGKCSQVGGAGLTRRRLFPRPYPCAGRLPLLRAREQRDAAEQRLERHGRSLRRVRCSAPLPPWPTLHLPSRSVRGAVSRP